MKKLFRWFKINVLKQEQLNFVVYFKHLGIQEKDTFVYIDEQAKSKHDAKKQALDFINKHAMQPHLYKFIKVKEK